MPSLATAPRAAAVQSMIARDVLACSCNPLPALGRWPGSLRCCSAKKRAHGQTEHLTPCSLLICRVLWPMWWDATHGPFHARDVRLDVSEYVSLEDNTNPCTAEGCSAPAPLAACYACSIA